MELIAETDIAVTDEVTLLKEKLREADAQIDGITRERDAALRRIGELTRLNKDTHRLLEMMTDASIRDKQTLTEQVRRYSQELGRMSRLTESKARWVALGGFFTAFIATGLAVAAIYLLL